MFYSLKFYRLFLTFIISFILGFNHKIGLSASLEQIRERGKLIVAIKDNTRPLSFLNHRNQLQGLEIDLAKQLAKDILGNADSIIFKVADNQERLQKLTDGEVDIVIARMTINSFRSRLVNFSPYYYLDSTGIITKNNQIENLPDLFNIRIAVLNYSDTISIIRSSFPKVTLIGVNSYQEALGLIENKQADAFAADNSVLAGWVEEYPEYHRLSLKLSAKGLGVAMPKGSKSSNLRNFINQSIYRLKISGWLSQRIKYWGLP